MTTSKQWEKECVHTYCHTFFILPSPAEELPNFPIDPAYLRALRGRMSLARQVHTIEYRRDKSKRADKWMTQSAEALGIELDSGDLYPTVD